MLRNLLGVDEISRRYFVMNTFDGVMTILGMLMGFQVTGQVANLPHLITMGFSITLGMAASGFVGAYLAESAERKRELKRISRAMLKRLDESIHRRTIFLASLWNAFIYAVSPALGAAPPLLPFLFAHFKILSRQLAPMASMAIVFAMLLSLGLYLGKISGEGLLRSALKTVITGIVVASLITALALK